MASTDTTARLSALQQATQMLLSTSDAETLLENLILLLRHYVSATRVAIYLLHPGDQSLSCRAFFGAEPALKTVALTDPGAVATAARTRSPQIQADGAAITHVLPLAIRDRILGALSAGNDSNPSFSHENLAFLSLIAAQSSLLLESIRMFDAERGRLRQVELLRLIARSAATAPDPGQFFPLLADLLSDTFDDAQVSVLLSSRDGELSIPAYSGTVDPVLERFRKCFQNGGLARAWQTRSASECDAGEKGMSCYPSAGSELYVPLVTPSRILGALVIARAQTQGFTKEDLALAQTAGEVSAAAVRSIDLAGELQRVTNIDPLTECYTQKHFHTVLAQEYSRARRYRKSFGLISLDLRHFSEVNAALGIEGGDRLLRQVAQTLRSRLRGHDVLCRYTGDQFAIVLPEITADGLAVVLSKLNAAVHSIEARIPGQTRPLSAAWAAVTYPENGDTESALLNALASRLEAARRDTPL